MATKMMRRLTTSYIPAAALFVLLLISLFLLSSATQNSKEFGRLYSLLLIINLFELVLLIFLIGSNILRLVYQYRAKATGSRLTLRMVFMFVVLSVVPVAVVYTFSLDFLKRGIDSWFDVPFQTALVNALELSRASLDSRMSDKLRETESFARDLATLPEKDITRALGELINHTGAASMTVFGADDHIIATSYGADLNADKIYLNEAVKLQLSQGVSYTGLDDLPGLGLNIRIVAHIPGPEPRVLQILYAVPQRVGILTRNVQSTYAHYEQLQYLRDPLKASFTITLSMVLMLSVLTAVWAAFFFARRLVSPIRTLAIGTRAVAGGDYTRRLPLPSDDEFGVLVQSFNDMTGKIAIARDEARRSQQRAEAQRAYLEVVLDRLSSGVLALDANQFITTANAAVSHILGVEPTAIIGQSLHELADTHAHLKQLVEGVAPHLADYENEWREQITLFGASGRQVLMCGGASLPDRVTNESGQVIVIEDITALIQAQRDAAWGEMARRLAHEIKNPLTPIQLSAERLRHKYLKHMDAQESELLDRCTHTIIQQVDSMKEMVKAFSDYARTPKLDRRPLALNELLKEVLDLYHTHSPVTFELELDPMIPQLAADAGRFRQLLHNLFKNALDALDGKEGGRISISTRCIEDAGFPLLELRVADNGPGFPVEIIGQVFEPYVTTKPRGSGLGLAIVKKIVEEHGGMIQVENAAEGGAVIVIHLPLEVSAAEYFHSTGVGTADLQNRATEAHSKGTQ